MLEKVRRDRGVSIALQSARNERWRATVRNLEAHRKSAVRIVVSGGAGYIGSRATRELWRRGHEVLILDNLSTRHRALT